ncbi:hypothetical protein PIB30_109237, partial [Stylosanthes scabra]|nr:hypothetical protein [Stylosanthes scabra]
KRRRPRICVEDHAYAWKAHSSHVPESLLSQPKRDQDSSKPKSATHRRRSPRICVGGQQLMFEAYAWKRLKPSLSYEDPRINVDVHAYTWEHAGATLKFSKSHAYAWSPTHMPGKQTKKGAEVSFH